MNHKWDHNKETGLSTCKHCDIIVKTYRVKYGGIAKCNPKAPPIPKCLNNQALPPLVCADCSEKLDEKKCDRMRAYYMEKPLAEAT